MLVNDKLAECMYSVQHYTLFALSLQKVYWF